jgi:hypothetical protein
VFLADVRPHLLAALLLIVSVSSPVAAQDGVPSALSQAVTRDEAGGVTTRAVSLTEPLQLDGNLTEPLYETVAPITDFVQNEPLYGQPATERTEVWLSFDDENVYVSVRAWESEPDRMVVNELRRDNFGILQNENFAVILDTFYDRRTGVMFQFNPLGGRMDGQVASEGNYNSDWNPIYQLATGVFDGGWTAELALPFKSLSYQAGQSQVWGINFRRINRWKNEVSYLSNPPAGMGNQGITFASFAATVVGLQAPPSSRTLDIKPYAIADVSTDVPSGISNDVGGDVGLDVRYALTQNLSADFTYNTDFAQVEADEQQVNLTRFSLFFPEKREFFLENAGLFSFGGAGGGGFGGGNSAPILFYSRRIGLEGGQEVPILGGGRLTGRTGAYSVGLINTQTNDDAERGVPSTNFTVARVRRDILRRSAIGAILTRRSDTAGGLGSAETYGVDADFAFFENLEFQASLAQTKNPGVDGGDTSFRARMQYDGDLYGLTIDRIGIGENFNPGVGFVRRGDIQRTFAQARYSPRPAGIAAIRQFQFQAQTQYVENNAGLVETREFQGQAQIQFENSDQLQFQYTDAYEFVPRVFRVATGVDIPVGGYEGDTVRAQFNLGQQRRVSGNLGIERSEFYGGRRWAYSYGGRVNVHSQLSMEPSVSFNDVETPYGDFTTQLYSSRVTYTLTPLMFVSGLLQYNSSSNSLSTNVRLRWEYQPGSELFVVFNEGRDTLGDGAPDLQNRALIVKFNRLFRF